MNIQLASIKPLHEDMFSVGQCKDILFNTLSWHGLVIMPSDCGYALCGLPQYKGAMQAIDALLNHSGDPIPLSVGSSAIAAEFVSFNNVHMRLLAELWPGQFTMVAPVRRPGGKFAAHIHAKETLGLRISLSALERQLAAEAGQPVTSAAIRDDKGGLIRTYDEAVDLVYDRLSRVDCARTPILGVRRRRKIDDREHSTVAEIVGGIPKVLREGAIPERALRPLMTRVSRAEYGDAT